MILIDKIVDTTKKCITDMLTDIYMGRDNPDRRTLRPYEQFLAGLKKMLTQGLAKPEVKLLTPRLIALFDQMMARIETDYPVTDSVSDDVIAEMERILSETRRRTGIDELATRFTMGEASGAAQPLGGNSYV